MFRFPVPLLTGYGTAPAQSVMVGDTPASQFTKSINNAVAWSMPVLDTVNVAKPLKVRFTYTGDVANNNYFMQLGYQAMYAGAVTPAAYTNTTEALSAPSTASYYKNYLTTTLIIPASTLTVQGWVNFVLTRLATNGSDTNTGNFQLINVTMEQ